ncbi:ABC transporter permease [Rhodococcus cercidiphylli]|uniref:ABC transporter permease n=1 Tax=Rhodococcus cercidiphylli TaxID=489916 RepID=A0ABU4B3Y4_9NOCA|nr:ABC transporter permease [Rhodococcus cercidiphylli]MDV6233200.1 ABC transporter permease [Rhodococcus cercidiphylli]
MVRSAWWVLTVAALAFTTWDATALTMSDMSMSCSKIGEGATYDCGDRAIDVLGVWPLIGVALLLATPPAVAAIAMQKSVSWFAVVVLLGLFVAGVFRITSDSYSKLLIFALPVAVIGSIIAAFQRTVPGERMPASNPGAFS